MEIIPRFGTDEDIRVWVNPSSIGDTPIITGTLNFIPNAGSTSEGISINIVNNGPTPEAFDNLLVTSSFEDIIAPIVPAPEPTTLSMMALGVLLMHSLRRKHA